MWIGTFEYGLYEYDFLTEKFVNYNQSNSSNIYIHPALIPILYQTGITTYGSLPMQMESRGWNF